MEFRGPKALVNLHGCRQVGSDRRLTPGKRQTGHVCTSLDMYGNALVDPASKWSFLFKTGFEVN